MDVVRCPNENCRSKNVRESGFDGVKKEVWWVCQECGEVFSVSE